jgi:hypothetical protein
MNDIENVLGDDETGESLDIWIDGAHAGSLSVDAEHPAAHVPVERGTGFHAYELRGTASMKDGRALPIRGSGMIAFARELQTRVNAAPDLAVAARTFETLPGLRIDVERATDDDFAAAESRLGLTLPRAYRDEVRYGGAFRMVRGEEVLATLYHPRELISPWDWITRYWGSPNQYEEMKIMQRDLCFADIAGPLVFFYAEDKRCPDGEPSFEHGFLDFVEMREPHTDPWEIYTTPGEDLCAWFHFMREFLYDAVIDWSDNDPEERAIAQNGWNVYRTVEQPDADALQMYLMAR